MYINQGMSNSQSAFGFYIYIKCNSKKTVNTGISLEEEGYKHTTDYKTLVYALEDTIQVEVSENKVMITASILNGANKAVTIKVTESQ